MKMLIILLYTSEQKAMSLINYEYNQSLRKNALKMLEKAKELERIKKENKDGN
jgi:hypothetical protein